MLEATVVKDWLTSVGILFGGGWALWRFGYEDWLRRRLEEPSLEGSYDVPEMHRLDDGRIAVSLRWRWRNPGTRPVFLDIHLSELSVYRISSQGAFIDPRRLEQEVGAKVSEHLPLEGFGFFKLEPGTTSSILTVPILEEGKTYLARLKLVSDQNRHATKGGWNFLWEKWQVLEPSSTPRGGLGDRPRCTGLPTSS